MIGNFRAGITLSEKLMLQLRLNNITDEKIADRADYAARQYRYLPGRDGNCLRNFAIFRSFFGTGPWQ